MLIRLPLSLFVATLVMACTPQGKPVAVADKTPVSDKAAMCRAKCMTAVETPTPVAKPVAKSARPGVHRVDHRPRVIRGTGRVAREVYVSEGPRGGVYGGAYGGRYAGAAVSVTETSSSSASYRYSESEERWGSRGGTYSSGSGGGYASGASAGGYVSAGSGRESRYGPPPAATGGPVHNPGPPSGQLAGITREGALTWPGKVEY